MLLEIIFLIKTTSKAELNVDEYMLSAFFYICVEFNYVQQTNVFTKNN